MRAGAVAFYQRHSRGLRWAFGLVMIVALLVYLDADSIVEQLRDVDWALAAPAIAALVALQALPALTWRYLAGAISGMEMRVSFTLRSYYAAQGIGGFTPANVGADAYRAHALDAGSEGWGRVLLPIVVQRLTSYISLALLGVVAALFVPVDPLVRVLLVLVPLGTLALVAVVWHLGRRGSVPFLRLSVLAEEQGRGRPFWTAVGVATGLGMAFHVVGVALTYVLLRSVTGEADAGPAIAALTVARVTTVLPLTPNGLGFAEAAYAVLLPTVGTSAEAAVAVAALTRLAMFVTMGLGFLILAAGGTQRRPARAEPAVPIGPVRDVDRSRVRGS
jgi:uncharacterized membrane protein YbhN (UPF0104 family)